MVIDWHAHIQECINKNKLIYGFHASAREKLFEKWMIIQQLEKDGKTVKQIESWFKRNDPDFVETYFLDLFSSHNLISFPKPHDFTIFITKDEIKYINSLNVSCKLKKFLLSTTILCKFIKIKNTQPDFNLPIRSYAYFLAFGVDEFSKRDNSFNKEYQKLTQTALKTKSVKVKVRAKLDNGYFYTKEIEHTVLVGDWIDWDAVDGYKFTPHLLEKKVYNFCNKQIKDRPVYKICCNCHKKFIPNVQNKRDLCDDCYQVKRRADWTNYKHKIRKKIEN